MTENQKRRMNDLLEANRQRELEPDEVVPAAATVLTDAQRNAINSAAECVESYGRDDLAITLREVLAQAGVRAEPADYVLLPRVMTAAMINAWSGGITVSSDNVAARTTFQDAWKRVIKAAPTTPAQVPAAEVRAQAEHRISNAAIAEFTAYVTKNYPANTIISDPLWHAPRLFAAAIRSLAQSSTADKASEVRAAEWISVEDRLPEEGQHCIVLIWPYNNRDNEQIECIADYIDGTFMNHEGDDMHPPSHWMPFPNVARPDAPSTAGSGNTGALGEGADRG